MPKAQADIVSSVIVILIAISLTSAALLWGLPLIYKSQDSALVKRVHNAFYQDLPSRIESIANMGGSTTFSLDVEGIWVLDEQNETISFTFFSRALDKAEGIWVGENCLADQDYPFDPTARGVFPVDRPSIVCAKGLRFGDGYNITYMVGFRELESVDGKIYKIDLVKPAGGLAISKGKKIQISRSPEGISQTQVGDKTLITTKIEILL